MMPSYIPFIMSMTDCDVLETHYSDCRIVRIPLDLRRTTWSRLPAGVALWIDPAMDGLHYLIRSREQGKSTWKKARNEGWQEWLGRFGDIETISDPGFVQAPKKPVIKSFVQGLLNECASKKPRWVSVPQLPHADDVSRNRINRYLADAAATWTCDRSFAGRLILPVILTHRRQLKDKANRTAKIKAVADCFKRSQSHRVWVVDESLDDSAGLRTLRTRFENLVSFHGELAEKLPRGTKIIGGPYWAMNLVLWARKQLDFPAICLGAGFRYYVSGGFPVTPAARVVLAPLRQRARVGPDLQGWLDDAAARQDIAAQPRNELAALRKELRALSDPTRAQRQVAKFYRKWFDGLASTPVSSRADELYEQFSVAYKLGRSLPDLPRAEGSARRRGRVAQLFRDSCL